MKSLKPSMREKKRYLFIEGQNLDKNIFESIREFTGILGLAEASPKIIKLEKGKAVLSVNRKSVDKVRAGIAVFPEKMIVKRVSGTLKSLDRKA